MTTDKSSLICNFCGKNHFAVRKLIQGPEVYICDECIELCYSILHDTGKTAKKTIISDSTEDSAIPSPKTIKAYLDQYIIGQEEAKEIMAVTVYNHYKRISMPETDDVELEKSNLMIIGPSGSGKTAMVQTIARFLDVPVAIADATSLTEAGYIGDDAESVVGRLLQMADYDVKKTERGIIFIDEIDKKSRKGDAATVTRDVSGEGVQQGLLKIVEGSEVRVPVSGKKMMGVDTITINTKNILFIVGGAFVGLEKIIEERSTKGGSSIGFAATLKDPDAKTTDYVDNVEPDDLIRYGIIPEFIGRFPNVAVLNALTEDQLVRILKEPKNALVKQYERMFDIEGVELEFDEESLRLIAKYAHKRGTGARGLRSIIEHRLRSLQFQLPDMAENGIDKVTINAAIIDGAEQPKIVNAS